MTKLWDVDEAQKTFDRWYNYLVEACKKKDISQHFKAKEKLDYDQLVIVKDIDVDLICPHHLLPVDMRVHIGYLPQGWILGLSKFARIAKDLAYPQTQEKYTEDLVNIIMKELEPQWCMAIVIGEHACMQCRGVKSKQSKTITSAIGGSKAKKEDLKKEFLKLVI